MTDKTNEYVTTVNRLIEVNKDGQEGFRSAADAVQNRPVRELLLELAAQRAHFAQELQRVVVSLGANPEESGSFGGAVHRGWMNLKTAITGKNEHAILEECERGEDSAVEAYREALGSNLAGDAATTVEAQYRHILQAQNRVRALRDVVGADRKMSAA